MRQSFGRVLISKPLPANRPHGLVASIVASDTPSRLRMGSLKKTQGREARRTAAISDRMMSATTHPPFIHRRIADQIGSAILCGQRAPGSLLPKEMEASADLGVSRSAYREAVRMLVAKGLVETRPKVGTHVTDRRRWQVLDPDVLRWAFHSGPSVDFIHELFELRGILEPHAAELAARRRNADHLALMGHALSEMARHGLGTEEGRAADQRFHQEILVATGNQALITLSASIGAAIHWTTVFKYRSANAPRDAMPDHRKLYAAIVDGDAAGAAQATRELIELALQDTRALLCADDGETDGRMTGRQAR